MGNPLVRIGAGLAVWLQPEIPPLPPVIIDPDAFRGLSEAVNSMGVTVEEASAAMAEFGAYLRSERDEINTAVTGPTQRLYACTTCGEPLLPDAAHCIYCGNAI